MSLYEFIFGKKKACPDTSADSSGLSQQQELCLSSFVDGEAGIFDKLASKRMLGSSYYARRYVDELERSSSDFKENYRHNHDIKDSKDSLWPKIAARIEQEERLTLLRSIPMPQDNRRDWLHNFMWSGAGAVAAAVVLTMVLPLFTSKPLSLTDSNRVAANNVLANNSVGNMLASNQPNLANLVPEGLTRNVRYDAGYVPERYARMGYIPRENNSANFSDGDNGLLNSDVNSWKFVQFDPSHELSEGPRNIEARRNLAPQLVEVDWVRSHGRVKVLRNPKNNSAIIWVNRNVKDNTKSPSSVSQPVFVKSGVK